jgi:hypothetical protein
MKTAAVALVNLMLLASAAAQDAPRDPMQPPPALRLSAAPGGSAQAETTPVVARHLMVIDGVRYVIDNGRRRGVGDLLGGARIERIEDSAIVVRNGHQLQRLPLFAGVVKRPVAEPTPAIGAAHTGARLADSVTRSAQALPACADRPPMHATPR